MRRRCWLLKLGVVLLCAAMWLGPAGKSWGDFYVIPVTSMTFKGDWNVNTAYNAKDVVFYDGSSWFSLAGNNQGHTPQVSSAYWTLLAQKGATGVLKTQVFTTGPSIDLIESVGWQQIEYIGWTYTKVSATSKLIITYHDSLQISYHSEPWFAVFSQIRVNGLTSDGGEGASLMCTSPYKNSYSATGLWSGIPQGNVSLTIWARVEDAMTTAIRGEHYYTTILVTEVE